MFLDVVYMWANREIEEFKAFQYNEQSPIYFDAYDVAKKLNYTDIEFAVSNYVLPKNRVMLMSIANIDDVRNNPKTNSVVKLNDVYVDIGGLNQLILYSENEHFAPVKRYFLQLVTDHSHIINGDALVNYPSFTVEPIKRIQFSK